MLWFRYLNTMAKQFFFVILLRWIQFQIAIVTHFFKEFQFLSEFRMKAVERFL